MENAIRNLGFEDLNGDRRVSDEFARYWKAYEGADSVVIVYFTHDAMGAYAAGASWGYADKAVVSYWGYNGEFFDAVPGSYEHETVHIFGALDETLGSSTCGEYSIFAVSPMKEMYKNTNHENCAEWTNSVMRYYWLTNIISSSSKKFIGWGDYDNDGILDPLDNTPWGNREKIGVFRNGVWNLDYNFDQAVENSFNLGTTQDISIVGDWNGDGFSDAGIFRPSTGWWYFDYNLDGIVDKSFRYGGVGDQIIQGDWQGTGRDGIAIFRPASGYWYFDYNLDGIIDNSFRYGGVGDQIIQGDWQGTGRDGIAIFRPASGYWYFDYNLDGIVDKSFRYGGVGDQIIQGDWQGTGRDGIAIFRLASGYWYFDYNLDGVIDKSFRYGGSTDQIIKGDWDGNGSDGIAIFRPSTGYWYFDYNLDSVVDYSFRFGTNGDTPKVGKWV
jgi:uncharacterized protein YneR